MNLAGRAIKKIARITARLTAPLSHRPVTHGLSPVITAFKEEIKSTLSLAAEDYWNGSCIQLIQDGLAKDPRYSLKWPVILNTMNVQGSGYIDVEFRRLPSGRDRKRWQAALHESVVGGIDPYWLYFWTSESTVHHCYHLARFQEYTGADIVSFSCVFEYGAGYGNLCRVARANGFSGEYAITDLPQFLALQRFYLSATGISATLLPLDEYASWMEREDVSEGIFIATWSFSETPLANRERVVQWLPNFGAALITFQDQSCGIDNTSHFRAIPERFEATHKCSIEPIAHMPGNSYLFALRRNWIASADRRR
jgi:hypothetical protein